MFRISWYLLHKHYLKSNQITGIYWIHKITLYDRRSSQLYHQWYSIFCKNVVSKVGCTLTFDATTCYLVDCNLNRPASTAQLIINGMVGIGFVSRYQFQPRAVFLKGGWPLHSFLFHYLFCFIVRVDHPIAELCVLFCVLEPYIYKITKIPQQRN